MVIVIAASLLERLKTTNQDEESRNLERIFACVEEAMNEVYYTIYFWIHVTLKKIPFEAVWLIIDWQHKVLQDHMLKTRFTLPPSNIGILTKFSLHLWHSRLSFSLCFSYCSHNYWMSEWDWMKKEHLCLNNYYSKLYLTIY